MRHDQRAQASGLIVFFLILGISALLWGILDFGLGKIFTSTLAQTNSQQATGVIETRQAIWSNLLFFILAFGGVTLIARSVVQSRR